MSWGAIVVWGVVGSLIGIGLLKLGQYAVSIVAILLARRG